LIDSLIRKYIINYFADSVSHRPILTLTYLRK